jgi:hypothetical protein
VHRALSILALAATLGAQTPRPDPLAPLRFLEGDWVGEGQGAPGASAGAATFRPELGGAVLVRRSFADYPAQGSRPPFRHEDLLVIHAEGTALRALYLDNENHVIHYGVTPLASGEGVQFLSTDPGPRFRMTYRRAGAETVAFTFEMAQPGSPEAFSTYLDATTRRKGGK